MSAGLVLLEDMNSVLLCLNKLHQFFLLGFILRRQYQKPLVANCSVYIIFINSLENPVKFGYPFSASFNAFLCRFIGKGYPFRKVRRIFSC